MLMTTINYSPELLMTSLETSLYGDHQPGKTSPPVVTSKEETHSTTDNPDKLSSTELLWELALELKMHLELTEPGSPLSLKETSIKEH